ncbi:uncharacterized protein LOC127122739 [Lathyrus oleraceus]|uniref:uncharacterized protein LOC127122739 n=1 Tax=Pisum sativum TaxID=3888 RepID=UPI0021D3489B|nr:uncharacterized protein LOC127122739 [Pisum sativum]
MASQVEPPLAEKELANWFMDIVQPMFYERMVGSVSASFSDLVALGIKVELSLKNGKMISAVGTSNNNNAKKFPGNSYPVQYVQQPYVATIGPYFNQQQVPIYQLVQRTPIHQLAQVTPAYQQAPAALTYQQPRAQAPRQNAPTQNRRQGVKPLFSLILMMYTELYPSLLQKGLVVPRPLGPPPHPLPPWYNLNSHFPFHEGAPGHDFEGCYALKHIVREFMEKKIFFHSETWGLMSRVILWPAHGTVNAVEEAFDGDVIKDVANIKTPLLAFHARLVEAGLGVLQVSSLVRRDEVVAIEPIFNLPEPIEITYRRKDIVQSVNYPSPVLICVPSPFPYGSTKAVPWKYDITIIDKESEESRQEKSLKVDGADVTNIARTGQMIRNGRIYTPQFNVTSQVPTKEIATAIPIREKNMVKFNEDAEFLKIIKKSDYKVGDKLHQTSSKISIFSLLMCFPTHRNALLKVLVQAHVTQDITVGQFDGVVSNITACNTLIFNGGELPKEGQNHNRALHVSVKCQEDILARDLVDTGSSLNVLPKRTLAKLAFQGSEMRPSALIVKAFDGSRRTVIGEVELPILIGPHVFNITFQVMDINPAYICLLGKPWIHVVGAVTSTLHQK